MKKPSENEVQKYFGRITIPTNDNICIEGVWLYVTENSIYVEIPYKYFESESWTIVFGEFIGISKITLYDNWLSGGSSGSGSSYIKLYSNLLVKGDFFNEIDLKFKKVLVTSPAFQKWIQEEHYIENVNNKEFVLPEKLSIVESTLDSLKVSIFLRCIYEGSVREMKAYQICQIELEFNEMMSMDSILDKLLHLKKLVLFLTNLEPTFSNYFLKIDDLRPDFELILPLTKLNEAKFGYNLAINYHSIKPHFEKIISTWFNVIELHPIIDLLLEKSFNTSLYTPKHFLNMCVSIESFHKNVLKQKKIEISDKTDLERREEVIKLLGSNNELLKWFKEKSSHWKEPTLKDRMFHLIETFQAVMREEDIEKTKQFITKAKKTRDKISHEGVHDTEFNFIELFIASKILEYVLRLEILKVMGLEINTKGESLVDRASREIQHLVRLNSSGV